MKKPTKDDLERVRADLCQMQDYFTETANYRDLSSAEMNVYVHLADAITGIDEVLFYLPDLRDNIVME